MTTESDDLAGLDEHSRVRTPQRQVWNMERQIRLVAGSIALGGVVASTRFPQAKWAAGFIGGGLTFSALTNTCTMGVALSKAPWNRSAVAAARTGSA